MDKRYDVIVVGAGNGGLAAAATTARHGLRTLLLERHNLPGGSATSFRRGRFEFETSLHELCDVGSAENPGGVRELFDELGADVDWHIEKDAFRCIVVGEDGFDVTLPAGIDAFVETMERLVPGSGEPTREFFALGEKAERAVAYLSQGAPDPKVMATEHVDFMRMASHTVREGFEALGMPRRAQDILFTYWAYLGATPDQLDLFHYAMMLYRYIKVGPGMPSMFSHELSLALEKVIRDAGGDVWYNAEVTRFLIEDGAAKGVVVDGKEIPCEHIIANCFPNDVFGHMVDPVDVPDRALKLANARPLGMRLGTVYLGMNRTAEELGIHDYTVFLYESTEPAEQKARSMSVDDTGLVIMNCLNATIPGSSPEGTCTLFFTMPYFNDAWDKLAPEEYKEAKSRMAEIAIDRAERYLGISIKPHIEEIAVASPVTFARYLNTPGGTPYGYQLDTWDGMMPRIMSQQFDQPYRGFRFCGAHAERGDGYSSAYFTGNTAAMLTLKDIKEAR